MSQAPHVMHLRDGTKMGDTKMIDTMIKDGLWDAFNGYHMGNTAENVAKQYQITRDEQDKFAVASQNKAEAAQKAGSFKDEIVPVTVKTPQGRCHRRRGRVHQGRRHARRHRQAEARLRQGRHGHGRQCLGHQRRRGRGRADDGWPRPRSAASSRWPRSSRGRNAGVDPAIMGTGPIPASKKALEKAGWTKSTIST